MGTPAAPDPDTTQAALDALAVSLVAGAVIVLTVGVLLLVAARQPFPASVVAALTVLATLSLVGYAVGGESRPELAAIAGTAVGALAGATTHLIARDQPDPDPPAETGP